MNKQIRYISSKDNGEIKNALKLRETKYQKQENLFLVEGFNIIKEALNFKIVKKLFTIEKNKDLFKEYDVDLIVITEEISKKMSSVVTSQNVYAVVEIKNNAFDDNFNCLILDNIQDPGNLGTLIRSAHAFDFKNIIISNNSVSPYNEKVIRSSQGLLFQVNILQTNIVDFLNNKIRKYDLYMTNLHDDAEFLVNISNKNTHNVAIVLGNEGSGISNEVLKIKHNNLIIKTNKDTESLNVSIAGSIIMNHFFNSK